MNKNEIINILEDWNFWKKEQKTGITRPKYLKKLHQFSTTGFAVVITGARRSGKSIIMRQFAQSLIDQGVRKQDILLINFEDPRLPTLDGKSLAEIFEIYREFLAPNSKPYVFLDEIQEVSGWEKWVRTMQELGKAQLIISGSNANLLSTELATHLTGRHLDLTVFPLSFEEFLKFNNLFLKDQLDVVNQAANIKNLLRKYLASGAYPEVVLSDQGQEIYLRYFEDIINKDLIKRYHIRKGEKMKGLAKFYLNQAASPITFNAAAKNLGLSVDTTEKFSGYLENAYLLYLAKRFSYKFKEQEKSPRKAYVIDTGLANAIGLKFSANWGRAAENAVFLELKRRQAGNPNLSINYWKDTQHREVDFVLKDDLLVQQLIQVCWDISDLGTKNREIKSLLKAMKDLKIHQALVVTEDQAGEEELHGQKITYQPLWQWLLG